MQLLNYLPPAVIDRSILVNSCEEEKQSPAFITANTMDCSFEEMKQRHIIPVFVKDNEPLISHSEFVLAASNLTADLFHGETILKPQVRVSHPIKGRIPEAKEKPANQLQEWEKTLYYERMMFVIEIPSITDTIDGNQLSLTLGGVKAYNLDNLYSRSLCDQHFKFFIGFKNKVCTNLCVWTDGYMGDLRVKNFNQLKASMRSLLEGYNQTYHLHHLRQLADYSITEQQFAHIIGRCRMYNHLPSEMKTDISPILFGDNQMSTVVKDFYRDNSFCRDADGNINLWKLYNLFTGANKATYIDSFLDRSVNAFNLTEQIRRSIMQGSDCWYLN
jgi:hypothetical protein